MSRSSVSWMFSDVGRLARAVGAGALLGLAPMAWAQCATNGGNYIVTQGGGTIVPGDTDTGNHCDDCVTSVPMPFAWSYYGTSYSTLYVSSNGTLQFTTSGTGPNAYGNTCPLPNVDFDATMCPYWDDLYTVNSGYGVYTSVSGAAPNRIFNVEWRPQYYPGTGNLNFEVRLYEGATRFDFVYGTSTSGGSGGTIGCQQLGAAGSRNTQFDCNAATYNFPASGTALTFDCQITAAPSCSLSVSPTSAYAGAQIQAHARVIEGTPASPPYTVVLDASQIGAGTVTLYDDGNPAHGDAVAGDLIYSNVLTVASSTTPGSKALTSTVSDSHNPVQSSNCGASFVVLDPAIWDETNNGGGDAGDGLGTAQTVTLPGDVSQIHGAMAASGNDADMYLIHICDPSSFLATTAGGTTIDTQLFLFDQNGNGVVHDDDDWVTGTLQSRITSQFVSSLQPGDFYLAISGYNQDPHDSGGNLIWANTCPQGGFQCERTPDGPGAGNPIDHWDTGGGYTGAYTIFLQGVSGQSCGPTGACCTSVGCSVLSQQACTAAGGTYNGDGAHCSSCTQRCGSADFNCDGDSATDADIEAFFACLAGNCPAPPCTSNADFNGDGDSATDADIEAFFRVLAGGTC